MIASSVKPSNRHWSLKERAHKLRSQGLSYKEIAREVPVAKSTISLWCRNVPLTNAQRKRLWEKRDTQLKGIKAIQKMFWGRRCEAFAQGVTLAETLQKNVNFVAGLMLYWAEGTKGNGASITNSDPRIIKFMVKWFDDFFYIPPQSLSVHLHLHSGQNEEKMRQYWSKLTSIPLTNFQKSFVKPEGSGYRKNVLYCGTVKVRANGKGSTYALFKIFGCIAGFLKKATNENIDPEQWMERLPYA